MRYTGPVLFEDAAKSREVQTAYMSTLNHDKVDDSIIARMTIL
jgi:hypothetical protein